MNKRQFIDAVRQYAALAKRKNKSYALQVSGLKMSYNQWCEDSGMSEPELKKESLWAGSFVAREYSPFDPSLRPDSSG